MERLKQMDDDSLYNMGQTRGCSFPPPLPEMYAAEPSELYQVVLRHSYYPPIIQTNTCTLAVPFKEQRHHRTPSESIGNNYSLRAQYLKIDALQQRQRALRQFLAKEAGPSSIPTQLRQATGPKRPESSGHTSTSSQPKHKRQKLEIPSSRPMSPTEQLVIMHRQEEMIRANQNEPSEKDLERYSYYINTSVPFHMLAPYTHPQMANIMSLQTPEPEEDRKHLQTLRDDLTEEVKRDYYFSLRKSIVDYILMDPSECQRVSISSIPKPFPRRVIRAPVPWALSCIEARMWQSKHLLTVCPIMVLLKQVWVERYSSLRFVKLADLFSNTLPLLPSEFDEFVQRQCQATREELDETWLPYCASLFVVHENMWLPLLSQNEPATPLLVQEFFHCVAALMSLQLRSLVIESLRDLQQFFMRHEEGNDFGEVFDELTYIQTQVLLVNLQEDQSNIEFSPSFQECWEVIHGAFMKIIKSAEKLPRLECKLFSDIDNLYLRTVRPDESLVTDIVAKVKDAFQKNTTGPKKYLGVYQKYKNLLDNTSNEDISEFLKENHSLEEFAKKIKSIDDVWKEVASLRINVPLSMFCLNAGGLNDHLCDCAERLKTRIVMFKVEENRKLNEGICKKYKEIRNTARSIPRTTEELVSLIHYIKQSSDVTIHKIVDEVDAAVDRLSFLMDYATQPVDDLKLNSRVFLWHTRIVTELENSRLRLTVLREKAEESLKTRIFNLDQRLQELEKDIHTFKKKEIINTEEIKHNVATLCQITSNLEEAVGELEEINKEQTLLDREQTQFPMLQTLIADKQPYEQLWNTAFNFDSMSEVWLNGPFRHLDAEKISDELDTMWRTMHKLTKTFFNLLGPSHVANNFKSRINQFKQHLPVLTTICNPGLKDRHWEKISHTVGFDVRPNKNSTLQSMLDLELSKFSKELEEIGASASKEFSLEKSMDKMKKEWADLRFSFSSYRDTDTKIVSAVDDVQLLLDDHIIKTQTMRGSPFIRPLEAECKTWEEKLLSMQDILDAMLKCQATWLYLEPIFSSEDIIAQMPEEGRKFGIVDCYWKNIIAEALKDTRVLVATGQPNMLEQLQESNDHLDEIQKGLNTYLEKKRLFFPRFFFLSNDELLEILSQTKDPLCVQPHLKKCFEGIAKLEFTEELEITGMVSSEKETVPFTEKIYPAQAKGMVEKWLLEVESLMLKSVRHVIHQGVIEYAEVPRKKWVLQWPGQVVICASSIFWTSEVCEAIQSNSLPVFWPTPHEQTAPVVSD
ncbi:hypothetical protein ILYODFUR_004863 [Ilyodon furcidens]|uniref:Dynein heavy chain linker domain-containing protein n=1 Tax=Ilyodon furcidens TaxID=33524 RepID=A0ABV0TTP3_9TELE